MCSCRVRSAVRSVLFCTAAMHACKQAGMHSLIAERGRTSFPSSPKEESQPTNKGVSLSGAHVEQGTSSNNVPRGVCSHSLYFGRPAMHACWSTSPVMHMQLVVDVPGPT